MLRRTASSFFAAAAASPATVAGMQRYEAPFAPLPPVTTSSLANGATVTSEYVEDLAFCTVGVWIDAGSRVETRANNGVAHFLEHINFKGSQRYTKPQIESAFEHIGGHFNAYTARDRTAYYLKVLNEHVDETMALLSDILLHSNCTERHVELERPTILAEMQEVESLVDEVVMDNLHLCAFDAETSGLPLTILGPTANISKGIQRQDLLDFVATHYTGPRMNIVCSGGLTHSALEATAQRYFGHISSVSNKEAPVSKYVGGDYFLWNSQMATANLAWAVPICPASDLKTTAALQLVHSIVGGFKREHSELFRHQPRPNSRFAAKPEVCGIQPFFTPYEETGLFGFYYTTVPSAESPDTLSELFTDNMRVLHELAAAPIGVDELEQVKALFKASQLLLQDSTTNRAEETGRQMIHYKRKVPLAEYMAVIDSVTPADVQAALQRFVLDARPTLSAVGHPATLCRFQEKDMARMRCGISA